jgi:CheY-like chemotaxis protein
MATPLHRVLERVANSVRPEAEFKKLRIRIVPTRLWGMLAPDLLERVLVNLAANAVRYTPAGTILLGVRRRAGAAELWVTDTGIGIADEDSRKIFQEFYQIGNPARNREQGYGLGLAIVQRLCVGMGWPLECQSTVGKGSTFKVTVPIVRPTPDEPTAEITSERSLTTGTFGLGVVIIDDDPLVSDATKRLIESWGARVEIFRSGDQALAALRERGSETRWHALVDYRLSGDESGLIVADGIRDAFGGKVEVTLITGETDANVFEQAALRGLAVLRKPVKPVRLRAILTAPGTGGAPAIEANPRGDGPKT